MKLNSKATLISVAATLCLTSHASANNTSSDVKMASIHTKTKNAKLFKEYPFDDTTPFKNAARGFIAPLPNEGVFKDADGKVIWNLKAFTSFINDQTKSPDTVNPSLWHQSQLLMYSGLFEVVEGVYQVRGADLSNMTIVEGKKGITIYDPLVTKEAARHALELYYAHRPKKPVVAVIYTHSHVDHFGGVRGVVDEADIKAGKVKLYAPEGFMEHAISENVFAGTAMSRRASYMYGNLLPPSPTGQVGAGLGITTSNGTVTLIKPTNYIKKTGEKHIIDGLEYEFLMAPGSEAPSEMMWYVPEYKMINTAEDSTQNMHNLYTLRGAKTRDAQKWPLYLNQALRMWGDKYEVEIGMHHWPTWGQKEVNAHIKSQRDIYKFMHDQTLHFANMGYTMNELPDMVQIPKSLVDVWGTHGYYGSKSHNVRAVYNFYLGYFDGNPAHLDPLPPEAVAKKYVEAMGGASKVMSVGKKAFDDGEYRWGAEVMNHLVFAQPENQDAKNLLADTLEQMGYQAESGPWRNFYLAGALELRRGVPHVKTPTTSSEDVISNMEPDMIFSFMGVQLDAKKAEGKKITINWDFTDSKEQYTLFLENSVLNHWPEHQASNADVTIILSRDTLSKLLSKQLSFKEAQKKKLISFKGDENKFYELLGTLTDLSQSFWFNIVTP